jgi:hypothetical protein
LYHLHLFPFYLELPYSRKILHILLPSLTKSIFCIRPNTVCYQAKVAHHVPKFKYFLDRGAERVIVQVPFLNIALGRMIHLMCRTVKVLAKMNFPPAHHILQQPMADVLGQTALINAISTTICQEINRITV